jgi:Uma2 family endonuclease
VVQTKKLATCYAYTKNSIQKAILSTKLCLNNTLRIVGGNRRWADRVIWTGIGRTPRPKKDFPSIIAEFVSEGRSSWLRDYITKRDEYIKSGAKEYLVIDRFRRMMTVYMKKLKKIGERVIGENEVYETPLLPGFQLPLARLLTLADKWVQTANE